MMRENIGDFFSRKVLLAYHSLQMCLLVLDVLFIYSKENCIIWHLLASISALLEFTGRTVIPSFFKQVHAPTYPLLVAGR